MRKTCSEVKIGIDTGGTFTDIVMSIDDKIFTNKILSNPQEPAFTVLQGIHQILEKNGVDEHQHIEIIHGSTIATNTLLERRGAKILLITTKNFEDILEIRRQARPDLYNLNMMQPVPLVSREQRFGVRERVLHNGCIQTPIDMNQLDQILSQVDMNQISAIAVCFLFSYTNPKHEQIVEEKAVELNIPVSASHKILPEYREFERFSTTVANAYVLPKVNSYISKLRTELPFPIRIMQSNGGSISAQTACDQPIRTVLSGPAGGVIGAFKVAQTAGFDQVITFDMGGTSTDVSLCDSKMSVTTESDISGIPIKIPMVDIHTVGSGGGSIAEIDSGGAFKVGPRSAGAVPGPICYGKGEEVTVTDANLYLGRIDPNHFLGGHMPLHLERVNEAIANFAHQAKLTPIRVAEGIIDVANAKMERAIRVISIERGFDLRDFAMVSFGGAGGLHACDLARNLGTSAIIIPPNCGLLSAYGMILSDVVKDYSQTVLRKSIETTIFSELSHHFSELISQAKDDMLAEGFEYNQVTFQQTIDVRYVGQSHELNIEFTPNFAESFHCIHNQRFGHAKHDVVIEIVNLRVRAVGKTEDSRAMIQKLGSKSNAKPDPKDVVFNGENHPTNFYHREDLEVGSKINGPSIIVELSATTLIPPDFTVEVDPYQNMIAKQK